MEEIQTECKYEGISIENNGSKSVVVSFGGIKQGIGIPVFEFYNILKDFDCDKIFVRDYAQMWYQGGIDSDTNSIVKLRKKLETIVAAYERVIFIGNSMGGYAAILFGVLLDVNHVIVFAPQTFIDPLNRIRYWDRRWPEQIKNVHRTKLHPEYYDLKKVLKNKISYRVKIELYYSSNDRLDQIHSLRCQSCQNVAIHRREFGGHSVVKMLKDSGELRKIFSKLFNTNKN